MTIVGIAGCTALLATGYGLRDSIFDVLTWQFDDLMPYNAAISISSDLTPSDRAELLAALRNEPGIADFTGCYEQTVEVRTGEGTVGNVVLHASADWKYVRDKAGLTEAGDPTGQSTQNSQKYTFDDYINLYPRGDGLRRYGSVGDLPKLTPTDEAIVIDEKLSTLLGIKEGDTVTLIDNDEAEYKAVVGGICENYVNHHIYMTHAYYKTVFGERPTNNLLLVKTANAEGAAEGRELDPKEVAGRVSDLKGVITYSRLDETREHFLNVTEWVRELATLKVLGFYDNETASYVYRENLILTALGAFLGTFAGYWLHRWLIDTISMDYMIFGRGLHMKSYVYAVILTIVFSLSVNFFSFFSIRKINMVESLKSVE